MDNSILGLFFLVLAINLFNTFCYQNSDFIIQRFIHVYYIGSPFALLYAPIFYFYLKTLTGFNTSLKKIDLIHFLPFLCYFTYLAMVFYFKPLEMKKELILNNQEMVPPR